MGSFLAFFSKKRIFSKLFIAVMYVSIAYNILFTLIQVIGSSWQEETGHLIAIVRLIFVPATVVWTTVSLISAVFIILQLRIIPSNELQNVVFRKTTLVLVITTITTTLGLIFMSTLSLPFSLTSVICLNSFIEILITTSLVALIYSLGLQKQKFSSGEAEIKKEGKEITISILQSQDEHKKPKEIMEQ